MVASGLGVSVVPSSAADFQSEKLGLVVKSFNAPQPSRKVALAFRRSFPRKDALEIIQKAIKNAPIHGANLL